ncbi:hypothetical protein NC653_009457 [Populus alba x Populus x berolinensis]|uniref:Uncharacterized protein n=1 Tax=Populus alba x Populus x berolinensis TaxID=444605 RepID=A0AAD6R8Z6_9ROSI|nr:hypothetical protein NC653_009457 [Populus alba x Populus x berolinensis]
MAKVLPLCERGKHARPRSLDIERSPYTFLPGKNATWNGSIKHVGRVNGNLLNNLPQICLPPRSL